MPNFTQKAIKESFIKLLTEKPLSKISVKDIVEDCGINRNSFYYHFQDIPALLKEIVLDETEKLVNEYPTIDSLDEALRVAALFTLNNKKAVLHIFNSLNRDVFEDYLLKACEHTVRSYLSTAFKDYDIPPEEHEIAVRLVKCLLFGMIIDWIGGGLNEDRPKDAARICELCRGIPEEIIERAAQTK
ncbi:transcriptional regulator, TetR family [Lachnospiraceae bacterium G11]|nr:transcriptional regulator, TetR family [Lachnospiraceae bacterium G11]